MRAFVLSAVLISIAACGTSTTPGGDGDACKENFAGCIELDDQTADTAAREVKFGGTLQNNYAPKCMKVKKGQTVTFAGDFKVHPLQQACGANETIPAVSSGDVRTVTFETAGDFGYFCTAHGNPAGSGMAGLIVVE